MNDRLRIGTRGSDLALWQAHHVKTLIEQHRPGIRIEIEIIKTTGDIVLDAPLAAIGDKGVFTKELETALLDRRIDAAVHSCKDIPTVLPAGLAVAAVLEREDARDVLIVHPGRPAASLAELPLHAVVATGSLRRKSQMLFKRPDLRIVDIRGNMTTRLKKLDASSWDALVAAKAGLVRLGRTDRIAEVLPFSVMLPAAGQGALAIETRTDDRETNSLIQVLHHEPTGMAVAAERAFLRTLEGGCQIPIGVLGTLQDERLELQAVIGSLDGSRIVRDTHAGPAKRAEAIGIELANAMLRKGGQEILIRIRTADKGEHRSD